jgi:hypothetical protein
MKTHRLHLHLCVVMCVSMLVSLDASSPHAFSPCVPRDRAQDGAFHTFLLVCLGAITYAQHCSAT